MSYEYDDDYDYEYFMGEAPFPRRFTEADGRALMNRVGSSNSANATSGGDLASNMSPSGDDYDAQYYEDQIPSPDD